MHPIRMTQHLLLTAWVFLTIYVLRDDLKLFANGHITLDMLWKTLHSHHSWVLLSCVIIAIYIALAAMRLVFGLVLAVVMSIAFMGVSNWIESKINPASVIKTAVQNCQPKLDHFAISQVSKYGVPEKATAKVNGQLIHYTVRNSNGNYSLVNEATGRATSLAGCNK